MARFRGCKDKRGAMSKPTRPVSAKKTWASGSLLRLGGATRPTSPTLTSRGGDLSAECQQHRGDEPNYSMSEIREGLGMEGVWSFHAVLILKNIINNLEGAND
jgi:hypothetical protein